MSEEEYRALDVVAREYEELAKVFRKRQGLVLYTQMFRVVADILDDQASRIRGRLCAEADREAVAEQNFRWQMFGESQHRDRDE